MKEICKYEKTCGSCSLLSMPYHEQLAFKTDLVRGAFQGLNGEVLPCIGCYYPYKYRNKIHLAFSKSKGRISIGFFEEYSKRIVDIDSCMLHEEWADKLIVLLRKFVQLSRTEIFDSETKTGNLRYAVARYLDNSLMLTLVIYEKTLSGLRFLYEDLAKEFKEVGIYININQTNSAAVFSDQFYHQFGTKKQNAQMLGVHFQLMPQSFFQVNQNIATKIYTKVCTLIEGNSNVTLLDLYSGIGISSMLFAKSGANVISIEIVPEAVAEAKRLAKDNKLDNICFYCGPCEEILPTLVCTEKSIVFLDPPRRGCDEVVLKKILEIRPEKIIYLSCNPDSLKQDLQLLLKNYRPTYIQPYDMFPQTKHIETLVCLRTKSDWDESGNPGKPSL